MIFATVGSHPTFGFERLLRGLEALPGNDLVVQYGPGRPPENAREAVQWMPFEQMLDRIGQASRVISHAGVGTVLCAIRAGHVPVVLPRLHCFGETVDDHQLEFARALADAGRVVLVERAELLAEALERAPGRGEAEAEEGNELVAAVRAELLASVAGSR